ncbi:MAG: ABC-type polysaccharide/polyol phosphate transport system ATPase subunit [Crocinitomicaceae bacterium]|jgi:lipopolysaccharide transport system ATP-binding protein
MEAKTKVLEVRGLRKVFYKDDGAEIIALNDVNFDLNRGEIFGVIGRNGSGKSTLLKVLSKITGVTDGEISYSGTLKSIIEIGTGFHADLSGKENVKLNAQLLGIPWKEFMLVYDDLVEFSGLEDFMNMPVKHYSSGMYLRLAFSIAFYSEIDILLLDEVLAVGDAAFRRKCYHKIRDLRDAGTAIILVSHQMEPIVAFCDRCMWIDNGRIQTIGTPMDVIEDYLETTENQSDKIRGEWIENKNDLSVVDYSNLKNSLLNIHSISVFGAGKVKDDSIFTSDDIIIQMDCEKLIDDHSFEIVYTLFNLDNVRVLTDSIRLRPDYSSAEMPKGNYRVNCVIPSNLLNRGVYNVSVSITKSGEYLVEYVGVFRFKVHVNDSDVYGIEISSVIRPRLNWDIELLKTIS